MCIACAEQNLIGFERFFVEIKSQKEKKRPKFFANFKSTKSAGSFDSKTKKVSKNVLTNVNTYDILVKRRY